MDSSAINQTIALIKHAIQAAEKLKSLEVRDALIAAREALNEQRETNLALKDENHDLKQVVADLRQSLEIRDIVTPELDCYAKKQHDGKEVAICSTCWEADGLAMTLSQAKGFQPKCKRCGHYFPNIEASRYANIQFQGYY